MLPHFKKRVDFSLPTFSSSKMIGHMLTRAFQKFHPWDETRHGKYSKWLNFQSLGTDENQILKCKRHALLNTTAL